MLKYHLIFSDSFTDEDYGGSVDADEEAEEAEEANEETEEVESKSTDETLPENVTER